MTDSNGANGRAASGRFRAGNPGGPGNPRLSALARHQQAIAEAVKPEELAEVVRELHRRALAGDVLAARVFLDRVLGKVAEAPVVVDIGGPVDVKKLRHGDGIADLVARLLAAAVAGEVAVGDVERLVATLERLGLARSGWGQRPDGLTRGLRELDDPVA